MATHATPTKSHKAKLQGTGTRLFGSLQSWRCAVRVVLIAVLLSLFLASTTDNAWRTSGSSSLDSFVSSLEHYKIVKSESVGRAMRKVDRAKYVRDPTFAYEDSPQPIGYDATISAPHMHAWCLELFEDTMKPGMAVLDVGSGSGYLTACFAQMLRDRFPDNPGKVIGIDIIPELVEYGQECTTKANPDLMAPEGPVVFKIANGWEGAPESAPFDFIHVGAAADTMPQSLVDQLAPGGKMVIPVRESPKSYDQGLYMVEKPMGGEAKPVVEYLMGVRYVPLVKSL